MLSHLSMTKKLVQICIGSRQKILHVFPRKRRRNSLDGLMRSSWEVSPSFLLSPRLVRLKLPGEGVAEEEFLAEIGFSRVLFVN